jgi:hypothetical protein
MTQEILSIYDRGYRFTSNVYKGYQHLLQYQTMKEMFLHHIIIDSFQDSAVNLGFNYILQFGFKTEEVAIVSNSVHDELHKVFGYQCRSTSCLTKSSSSTGTPLPDGPGMTSMNKLSSESLLYGDISTPPLPIVNAAKPSPISIVAPRSQTFEPIDPSNLDLYSCGSCNQSPARSDSTNQLKKTKTSLNLDNNKVDTSNFPSEFPDIKPENDYYNKFTSNAEAFFSDVIFHAKLKFAWALAFPLLYAAKIEFIEADFPNWAKTIINWVGIRPLEGVFMLDTLSKVTLGEDNPLRSNILTEEISNDYINPRAEDDWHKEFMEALSIHMSVQDTAFHMFDYAMLIYAQVSKTGLINTAPNIVAIAIILAAFHYNTDHKHAEIDIAIEERKKHSNEDIFETTEEDLCLAGQCATDTEFTSSTDF